MNKEKIITDMVALLGNQNVYSEAEDLFTYGTDGYTIRAGKPTAVLFPCSTTEVAKILSYCHEHDIAFIPRGAGTGLSGGTLALNGEVIVNLVKMKALVEVDYASELAVVEPGLVNLQLTREVQGQGYYYAPDPSSQQACTIGGNVAENSGGPHCLKYGVTTNHVLALELVLPTGEIIETGNGAPDMPGYDLPGIFTGSEGTLGVATKITVRLLPKAEASRTVQALFHSVAEASQAVSDIIAAGITPAALEMMDALAIRAVELGTYRVGYPEDLQALLLTEVDGVDAGLEEQAQAIFAICQKHHVQEVRIAQTEEERTLWWANRKTAFGAMGNLSPDYYVQDGVIPRSKLPETLARLAALAEEYQLPIANVFHAGDGNLHPLIPYDKEIPGEVERVIALGSAILAACVDVGGSITGEHGVGIEKQNDMKLLFSPEELSYQQRIRQVFNPKNLCNPNKLFPLSGRCADIGATAN